MKKDLLGIIFASLTLFTSIGCAVTPEEENSSQEEREKYENSLGLQNVIKNPRIYLPPIALKNIVEALLDVGADANFRDEDGNTLLHLAAWYGYFDVVKLLLEYGALVNVKNKFCHTPLDLASKGGHVTVEQQLLRAWIDTYKIARTRPQ